MSESETNRVQEIAENIKSRHIRGDASPIIHFLQDEEFQEMLEYDKTCFNYGWEARQVRDDCGEPADKYAIVQKRYGKYRSLYNPDDDSFDNSFQPLGELFSDEKLEDIDSALASIDESYLVHGSEFPEVWEEICELIGYSPVKREFKSYWDVSPWLAEQLKAQGEIIRQVFHLDIWCRTSAGTDVYMDEAILKIAASEEIQ